MRPWQLYTGSGIDLPKRVPETVNDGDEADDMYRVCIGPMQLVICYEEPVRYDHCDSSE